MLKSLVRPRAALAAAITVVALSAAQSTLAANFLYGAGHTLDASRLSTFGGHTQVATFSCADSDWLNALGGSLGAFDAIVVGESCSGGGYAASTYSAIADYVSSGGRLIVLGAHHNSESAFLNNTFGYSTTLDAVTPTCCEGFSSGAPGPDADGTSFASGPGSLKNANATWPLRNTPGKLVYADANGATWVFADIFGSGEVIYLAWDFCCSSGTVADNWYDILDRAFHFAPLDFGDAPAPYPTLAVDDGARHVAGTLFLGSAIDVESDGLPDASAQGDDNDNTDDEDGVVFSTLTTGQGATLTATVAGGPGKVDAWIDFNQDGVWSASEKIANGADVATGSNPLNFNVPTSAKGGATFARVRLSSAGVTDPTGSAPDGEVEDYQVSITDLSPNPFTFAPKINVPLSTFITSAKITPIGYAAGSAISVSGGTYSIGCTTTFTSAAGTISPGQSVCVRVKSAATRSTSTGATLTIGGVSGSFLVTTIPPAPVVTLTASPTTVSSGGSTTLTWTSKGAATCTGVYGTSSWATPKPLSGSTSSGPINGVNGSKPFRITCQNPGGSASANVVITVR